jgi:ATP-binding cassette subfamily B protein
MYLAVILYFTPRIKAISQEIFLTNSMSQARLIESLNGIETLKATANEYMARANWENAFVENVNRGFQSARLNLMSGSLNKLVGLSSSVVILWIGANQVIEGAMSIGELMGFNMLTGMVIGPILAMVGLWNNLLEVPISVDRVGDILEVKSEQEPITHPEKIPATLSECQGKIEFSKVNFSYVANDKENFVMKDFDLVIEPGQRVGFVGPSGCGKSTIAKMILGFNLPKTGTCTIDNKDIKSIELAALRRNIGVVLQDSFIFSGTVAENIALGDPEPDLQAVTEAARLAGAHEFVINYPLDYQTPIGEKGMGISGGQRQRICIARALYRKPKILIFDEATSALDNESEKRIQENMAAILRGRTSITIAHRLSTIIDSDMICYISGGKVAEKGTHAQLTDPEYLKEQGYKGLYYKLAQAQFNLPALEPD